MTETKTVRFSNTLRTSIKLPASKSISGRALIVHALTRPASMNRQALDAAVSNASDCDDTQVMIAALADMPDVINIKAAGTAMRFLTAYLSVTPGSHVITGTERMQHRPIGILVDALRTLGADINYVGEEGFPPLRITGGTIGGGRIALPGNVSSQYISALLMIAPTTQEGLTLELTGHIVSRPYIDMTLSIMREFGAVAAWEGDDTLHVCGGGYKDRPYYVESDWSASSYWYEMMALSRDTAPEVILPGLFRKSLQGDSAVSDLFRPLGVETSYFLMADGTEAVRLTRNGQPCERLDRDLKDQPDLAQTLVVTCAMMGVPFCFAGLGNLKIKETDRIAALRTELRKLGYVITEPSDGVLAWDGERCEAEVHPAINTYEDHRMAMAFAPAAMCIGSIDICDPAVVSKSYPTYWQHIEAVCS